MFVGDDAYIVPAEQTDLSEIYGKFAAFLGPMCTGKRWAHIRNAPSSRTAVTGIGPYTDGTYLVLLRKSRTFFDTLSSPGHPAGAVFAVLQILCVVIVDIPVVFGLALDEEEGDEEQNRDEADEQPAVVHRLHGCDKVIAAV